MESLISKCFIAPLGEAYGAPRNGDFIAAKLAEYCPPHATEEGLRQAARRIIETRRGKSFPAISELIGTVRVIPPPVRSSGNGIRQEKPDFAEETKEAYRALYGLDVTEQAIAEQWAPALVTFYVKHKRAPNASEAVACRAESRANDASAAKVTGRIGETVRRLRKTMHETASRRLYGELESRKAEDAA